MPEALKRCSRCKVEMPRAAFASNRSTPDGLQAYCRDCSAQYYKRRQEAKGRAVRVKVPVPRGHKRCPQCGEVKPHSEWERNKTSSDGWCSYCRVCRAQNNRAGYFMRTYGITEAQRDEMISSQMGICLICLSAPAVHVDHCHETGKVRGVLCFNCNSAIGKLGDDPDTLRRAITYLEGIAWKPTLVAPGVYQLPS
ncbi:endonuclease VII domain-containing protein [Streptomyces sp. A3M-1-3]|uniref:endonuclease VII domain-containing protein n=1 Tax=Streptomyces sp. A3M-1-3 TaxID=2962044 RepID=UPI0020B71DB6|nr:endonuclease VII domain-containing protein [Streptomyces sp. A3M-1-3]MCP3817206.1 endonuclease VII domain-containing protein [Streptomyces sp. A3M-1-3]